MAMSRHAPIRLLARFARDNRAVAALEFALVLPVLVLVLFGTVEIGNALLLDRKVTAAAQTAADLVAQQKSVTAGDIANIWRAIDNIIAPFDTGGTTYRLLSMVADEDANVTIDWQQRRGGTALENMSLPEGLATANESVIVAQITYSYVPVFGDLIFGSYDITDIAYLRPRTVEQVELR
jgi:Flp pilus assembly protein TadG